jgi:hypothetical protein
MNVSTHRPLTVACTRLAVAGHSGPSDRIRPTNHLLTGRNAEG